MGQTYVYSRVSTGSQDTSNQTSRLKELYPNAVFVEEVASGGRARPQLEKLVQSLQSGDSLITSSLDRLGRKASEILLLIELLDRKQVTLKSLREDIDFSSPAGRLIFQVMAAVGELEKRLISERTKAALAAKRKLGIIGGRRPTYSEELVQTIRELRVKGHTLQTISDQTGVSVSRIYQLTKR